MWEEEAKIYVAKRHRYEQCKSVGLPAVSPNITSLRTRTEIVLETLGFSPFNQLMPLVAREVFIILSCRESFSSYRYEQLYF
jgi:hypothetical protein